MPNDQPSRSARTGRPSVARPTDAAASDFDPGMWRLFDAYVHG